MPTFSDFLYTQLILKIPIPATSFASKTVIITGANSGLGKETAKHIVRLGATKVILGCRTLSKGEAAKEELDSALNCPKHIIEVWQLDLESPSSITEFVDKANQLPRLDVVINNAGMQSLSRHEVAYGTERTIAVNVIGTLLLAIQLIPKLKETVKIHDTTPHMTFVASALYDIAKYPENHEGDLFTWLAQEGNIPNLMEQYNLSKLLLLHCIIKLSSLIQSDGIIVNSLDPCFCKTGLPREASGPFKVLFKLFEVLFARTAEEGSRLVVQAASATKESHGKYFRAAGLRDYEPFMTSAEGVEGREYIWECLGRKLEEVQPGALGGLQVS
ncbi:hypothetical protein BJY04DRAFT_220368 [Aspergillus karnatakaensis]|uniref:uncharacterized protein n=1 Tax=Aspergillus karnatakaensis TaxID=1810916 RepID=UPI003CCDC17D